MKNYTRIIPRDFFNEAKLLKCLGRLSLFVLDKKKNAESILINEVLLEPGFKVVLTDCGHLKVENFITTIKGERYSFYTPYNSKRNYPLLTTTPTGEEIKVFDEEGDFTKDFKKLLK